MIEITLDGDCVVLSGPLSIQNLLEHLDLDPHTVTALVNREAVAIALQAERRLHNGDAVKLIPIVGGLAEIQVNCSAPTRLAVEV